MDNESFIKRLLGVDGKIPDSVMNGVEVKLGMLTMIGYRRLNNIRGLIANVLLDNIEGDLIETGVWRGGACIFMRHLLNQAESQKKVFVADSFEGCPEPLPENIHDKGDRHFAVNFLAVSLEEVKRNFENFGLTENVVFLKGWFKDTLPTLTKKFSIIRLDGDLYSSTMDAISNLYPRLSVGGYCIVDDYYAVNGCRMAIEKYRQDHGITDPIINIDGTGVYWQKTKNKLLKYDLNILYLDFFNIPSDINEHLPVLRSYYEQCDHVTEFGVRGCISLSAALASGAEKVIAYDISNVDVPICDKLKFFCASTLEVEIEKTDMLFIDSLHTYEQAKRELSMHSSKVKKFIGLHDTVTFGDKGEDGGDGLNRAISEFLQANPEWETDIVLLNNNGLTILKKR